MSASQRRKGAEAERAVVRHLKANGWPDGEMPSAEKFTESECFVAGAISTMDPFRNLHPAWCLPIARKALDALSEWEPSDA